jgi:hypothetical protein
MIWQLFALQFNLNQKWNAYFAQKSQEMQRQLCLGM